MRLSSHLSAWLLASGVLFAASHPAYAQNATHQDVPVVTSVSSDAANGVYGLGDTLEIRVHFSDVVNVKGMPTLLLATGATQHAANYLRGSGSKTLIFAYAIQPGDMSPDLNYADTTALSAAGGSITDASGANALLTLPAMVTSSALAGAKAIAIDATLPTVTNVSSDKPNGTYSAGATINILLTFSKAVYVTGKPVLDLNVSSGAERRQAVYSSGSGSKTLVFSYKVQIGDTSADLNYASSSALNTADGAIKDNHNNNVVLVLPDIATSASLAGNRNLVIDAAPPMVTSVTSVKDNGIYGAGAFIPILVNFSKTVVVTGKPSIALETGATDRLATYFSGSGSDALVFVYNVHSGDTSTDLNYASTQALALNDGSIKDKVGNTANLTLPGLLTASSLGGSKSLAIDATGPMITSVTSATANGTYAIGASIYIHVNFSKPVYVRGHPRLALETGGTFRSAGFYAGSGSKTLVFVYAVQAKDTSAALNYQSVNALSLEKGGIQDSDDNNALLTLPALATASSLAGSATLVIDTNAPTVINVSSPIRSGTYAAGEVIPIHVLFSENVAVTGKPTLALETGNTNRPAVYVSGSGSKTLIFAYTVQPGDSSNDLEYAATTALSGGTVKDIAGNPASLTLPGLSTSASLAGNKAIVIDASTPTVTSVTSDKANGHYGMGERITCYVNFSKNVVVTGNPTLVLDLGSTTRTATYIRGSGTNLLAFSYIVQPGDTSPDLNYAATHSLSAGEGGSIKDAIGNNASLILPNLGTSSSLAGSKSLVIDATVPTVTSVSSEKGSGNYVAGAVIPLTVAFSNKVVVTGKPTLALNVGAGKASHLASYSSGSGTDKLIFNYTVQSGDIASRLNYASITALSAKQGAIKDTQGNDALLALPGLETVSSLAGAKNISIDGTVPTVTSVTTDRQTGVYAVGARIDIQVTFSKAVKVTGVPKLRLETGTIDKLASYSRGSGTKTLDFTYVVAAGDSAQQLNYSDTGALIVEGAAITDNAGNAANISLPGVATSSSLAGYRRLTIDTATPTIVRVTTDEPSGTYTAGDVLTIFVNFSSNVVVTGRPQLLLETGTSDHAAIYMDGSGTRSLAFVYTVQAGDSSPRLNYAGPAALTVTGASIQDTNNIPADLLLPGVTTSASLANNRVIVLDATIPTVANVTSSLADGTYGANTKIPIEVQFSKPVLVKGRPVLTVKSGATYGLANFIGGSGLSSLDFEYIVRASDNAADLNYYSPASLSVAGGSITDILGHSASLTLPALTTASSLAGNKNIALDATAPTIVSVSTELPEGTYAVGENIPVAVVFSEAVHVEGWPRLILKIGNDERAVEYTSGSGSNVLIFNYAIQVGDSTNALSYSSVNAFIAGDSAIRDGGGNRAKTVLPALNSSSSLAGSKKIGIDGTPPPVPTTLKVTPGPESVTVAWGDNSGKRRNAVGNNGYVVVRRAEAPVIWAPTNKTSYVVGTDLGDDQTVVYVGSASEFTDKTLSKDGIHYYMVTAYDGARSYSGNASGAGAILARQWTVQSYMKSSNADSNDNFGDGLAVSGNMLVIGATGEASLQSTITNGATASADNTAPYAGAAYVFRNSNGTWQQEAYLKAANPQANDFFGYSVAADGDTIAVGAYNEDSNQFSITNGTTASSNNSASNSGAVYVFVRSATGWVQQAYLKVFNVHAGDNFGWSLALKGNTLVVGAPNDASDETIITNGATASVDHNAPHAGAAYVFVRSGDNWTQEAYLKAPDAEPDAQFGWSVATEGDIVLVGAKDAEVAYFFYRYSGAWMVGQTLTSNAPHFGVSVALNGNNAVVGADGSAFVFNRGDQEWNQIAELKAANGAEDDHYGHSVSLSGNLLVVGAAQEDSSQTHISHGTSASNNNSAAESGAAYIYRKSAKGWMQEAYVKAPNGEAGDYFGNTVSVSGEVIAISASYEDGKQNAVSKGSAASGNNRSTDSGAAYVLVR